MLGRSSVPPDMHLIHEMIVGRTIMIARAGGSIGSELWRKIAQWPPKLIVLCVANEFALYRIDQELTRLGDVAVVPVLGSITDARLLARTMNKHGVAVVFTPRRTSMFRWSRPIPSRVSATTCSARGRWLTRPTRQASRTSC